MHRMARIAASLPRPSQRVRALDACRGGRPEGAGASAPPPRSVLASWRLRLFGGPGDVALAATLGDGAGFGRNVLPDVADRSRHAVPRCDAVQALPFAAYARLGLGPP